MTRARKNDGGDDGAPGMKLEQWPVARLVPYAKNPRKNDDPAVIAKMAASIREYGFKIPMLARSADGLVVDGHLRLKAAMSIGMESVPVIPCDEWTEAQVKAFRLMAYSSARWAALDRDLARLELLDLRQAGLEDLGLTGLEDAEIARLLAIGTAPDDFREFGEDIVTSYRCPKCGYEWSGKPGGGIPPEEAGAEPDGEPGQ